MEQKNAIPAAEPARPAQARNPYIMNFCKVLVEKKGEELSPEVLKKLLSDMYTLFENMLGQNMIEALPENLKKEYLTMAEDLQNLNYEKIASIFDANIPQYQQIMKETMKEFGDIFLKNRDFNPENFPVKFEAV